jgi:hypothetical protein
LGADMTCRLPVKYLLPHISASGYILFLLLAAQHFHGIVWNNHSTI